MSSVGRTAICYRADGSFKWATLLPEGSVCPPTTLEDGDTLWPNVAFGREDDGHPFKVPVSKPLNGPMEASDAATARR